MLGSLGLVGQPCTEAVSLEGDKKLDLSNSRIKVMVLCCHLSIRFQCNTAGANPIFIGSGSDVNIFPLFSVGVYAVHTPARLEPKNTTEHVSAELEQVTCRSEI